MVKNSPANVRDAGEIVNTHTHTQKRDAGDEASIPVLENSFEKKVATHSSILACIP